MCADESNEKQKAVRLVAELLAVDPEMPAAYRLRASLLVDVGDHAKALVDIERYEDDFRQRGGNLPPDRTASFSR